LVKTPIVAILGPPTEKRWWPYRKNDRFLIEEDLNKISVKDLLKLINF